MSVKRYRITADFYASDDLDEERVIRAVAASINAYCPLGVVEGYPDIQEIAQDSPFEHIVPHDADLHVSLLDEDGNSVEVTERPL